MWEMWEPSEDESCSRCNYGIGTHSCWRKEIQAMPPINIAPEKKDDDTHRKVRNHSLQR